MTLIYIFQKSLTIAFSQNLKNAKFAVEIWQNLSADCNAPKHD